MLSRDWCWMTHDGKKEAEAPLTYPRSARRVKVVSHICILCHNIVLLLLPLDLSSVCAPTLQPSGAIVPSHRVGRLDDRLREKCIPPSAGSKLLRHRTSGERQKASTRLPRQTVGSAKWASGSKGVRYALAFSKLTLITGDRVAFRIDQRCASRGFAVRERCICGEECLGVSGDRSTAERSLSGSAGAMFARTPDENSLLFVSPAACMCQVDLARTQGRVS